MMAEHVRPDSSVTEAAASHPIQFVRHGAQATLTFGPPQTRNTLDLAQRAAIAASLPKLARDPEVYGLILRSSVPDVFCSGADLDELGSISQSPTALGAKLAQGYRLVWELSCFPKPILSLIDGLVAGAGVGLTQFGTHRIAGEHYRFQLNPCVLGLVPDDGLAHVLARLPGALGQYLALTGHALTRADAFASGLVTHVIDATSFDAIAQALARADPIDQALDGLHQQPAEGELARLRPTIDACFAAPTVEEILDRLATHASGKGETAAFANRCREDLLKKSPLALKVTLKHIEHSAQMDVRTTLKVDLRLTRRLMARDDFAHAIAALTAHEAPSPTFTPASLHDVSDASVARCFAPDPAAELELPTLTQMPLGLGLVPFTSET